MAVFRVEKTKDYTVMSNYHLRDKELSLKAKGLLSLMLSLPDNWDYTLEGLSLLLIIMCITFSITFYFGVFANPNFNIYDFCMNLSSEILGLVIALVLVHTYIKEKNNK